MPRYPVCAYCHGPAIKCGKIPGGTQRYKCKTCNRTFLTTYRYSAYAVQSDFFRKILVEGMGIRSIGRVLGISCATVMRKIRRLAKNIRKPEIKLHKEYEVDEMRTYIRKKANLYWIVYALYRKRTLELRQQGGKDLTLVRSRKLKLSAILVSKKSCNCPDEQVDPLRYGKQMLSFFYRLTNSS